MTVAIEDREAPHFEAYTVGLCYASVCTSLDDESAASRLNWEHPTGVHPWQIADDPNFAKGQSNSCPCPHRPGCRHILFSC